VTYKYWGIAYPNPLCKGKANSVMVGPFASRQEAIDAAMAVHRNERRDVLVGYGEFGPHFDLRWHRAEKEGRLTPLNQRSTIKPGL
jgi:hypothetical protein